MSLTTSSPQHRQHYEKHGFVVWKDLLKDTPLLDEVQQAVEEMRQGNYPTGVFPKGPQAWWPISSKEALCKIEMCHNSHPAFQALLTHPPLAQALGELTESSLIQMFWLSIFYKTPVAQEQQVHHQVGWHQDWLYWNPGWEEESELFTAWIPLTPMDEDSGTMQFLPGSHRWGYEGLGNLWSQELEAQLQDIETARGKPCTVVQPEISKGDVSFHKCMTFHGSGINTSRHPRSALVLNLRTHRATPRSGTYHGMTQFLHDLYWNPILVGKQTLSANTLYPGFRREW